MDNVTPKERSRIMSATKGRGNKSTEQVLIRVFRQLKISGWRRHLPLPGRPDFGFSQARLAVFVDGCFWHGCPQHCRMPASNVRYWKKKIGSNISRDQALDQELNLRGWRVLRFWEHDLTADPRTCAKRVLAALKSPCGTRWSRRRRRRTGCWRRG